MDYVVLTNLLGEIRAVGLLDGMLRIVPRTSPYVAKTQDFLVARQWARWAVMYAKQPDTKIVMVDQ